MLSFFVTIKKDSRQHKQEEKNMNAWNNFNGGNWENEINVRDFIQKNYTPYDGDGAFRAPPRAVHRTSHAAQSCVR